MATAPSQGKVPCSTEQTSDQSKCQKHKGEVNWFYCETCKEFICPACTVIDHREPKHHIIDCGEASLKYGEPLKDIKRLEQKTGDINLGKPEVQAVKWEMCRTFSSEAGGPEGFNGLLGITASGHEIAVADSFDYRVIICSNEGQHKGTIPLPLRPEAVAAIHSPEQRLLVLEGGSKYVKVFNMKDYTLDFQFPKASPSEVDKTRPKLWSAAVKKGGALLVGDVKSKMWTEHRPTDGEILRTIPVRTPPYYLAVHDDTDRVVISGYDYGRVDVVDSTGTVLSTIKPSIAGEPAEVCKGVCCDSSGIYLVVSHFYHCDTGHIHQYDIDGRFLDCLAHQGMHDPRGITFTSDGELAVADTFAIKMYRKV